MSTNAGGKGVWDRLPRPTVSASILSADFASLGADCVRVLEAGADTLHLDVMDGHFVPNLTMGPALCASLRRALPDAVLDVHLMVSDPAAFVEPFAEAGADHLTFHVEAVGVEGVAPLAARIRELGLGAGVAVNPDGSANLIAGALADVDMALVMSVFPGFSGQGFIAEALETTRRVRELGGPELWIQMDGGVAPANAHAVRDAGCDVLVSASAIFRTSRDEWSEVIRLLRGTGG